VADDDRSQAIRAGFGRLAVTVAVISTFDDGQPHGCTGMAWAEHVTPPLLLTTLRRSGRTRELVEAAGRFGVSVLSEELQAYAAKFAAKESAPGARFSGVPFSPGPAYGLPLLDEGVAAFECEVTDIYPFGGHDIVVGQVAWASAAGAERPLIHYAGHLWGLREADA
jgi:flavin reductase (DIM6/NTAB) family NADH-FMN oxidoreductase RutF